MHGIFAGIIANLGRNIIEHVFQPNSAQAMTDFESLQPFSDILETKQLDGVHSLEDILKIKPDISRAELMTIGESLKIQMVSSHLMMHGDMKPLAIGPWNIETSPLADGTSLYRVTDEFGHSISFKPDTHGHGNIRLIQDIQIHLDATANTVASSASPATLPFSTTHAVSPHRPV